MLMINGKVPGGDGSNARFSSFAGQFTSAADIFFNDGPMTPGTGADGGAAAGANGADYIPPVNRPNEHDRKIVERIRAKDTVFTYGARVFVAVNANGNDVLGVAYENMTDDEKSAAGKHFDRYNRSKLPWIICQDGALGVEDVYADDGVKYTVYYFEFDQTTLVSLRECKESALLAQTNDLTSELARTMLLYLTNYMTHFGFPRTDVEPFGCFSLDTVYVNCANGLLFVLPLFPFRGHYPVCAPAEFREGKGNDKSDIYMAAYTACDVGLDLKNMTAVQLDDYLIRASHGLQQVRPTLSELINNWVGREHLEPATFQVAPAPSDRDKGKVPRPQARKVFLDFTKMMVEKLREIFNSPYAPSDVAETNATASERKRTHKKGGGFRTISADQNGEGHV